MFRKQLERITRSLKQSNPESKLDNKCNILLITTSTNSQVKNQLCELLKGSDYRSTIGLSCYSFQSSKQKVALWEHTAHGRFNKVVINNNQNIETVLICDDSLDDIIASIKKLNPTLKQNCWVVTSHHSIKKSVEEKYGVSVIDVPSSKSLDSFFMRVTEKRKISEKSKKIN